MRKPVNPFHCSFWNLFPPKCLSTLILKPTIKSTFNAFHTSEHNFKWHMKVFPCVFFGTPFVLKSIHSGSQSFHYWETFLFNTLPSPVNSFCNLLFKIRLSFSWLLSRNSLLSNISGKKNHPNTTLHQHLLSCQSICLFLYIIFKSVNILLTI